jgi:hypothetical protein
MIVPGASEPGISYGTEESRCYEELFLKFKNQNGFIERSVDSSD